MGNDLAQNHIYPRHLGQLKCKARLDLEGKLEKFKYNYTFIFFYKYIFKTKVKFSNNDSLFFIDSYLCVGFLATVTRILLPSHNKIVKRILTTTIVVVNFCNFKLVFLSFKICLSIVKIIFIIKFSTKKVIKQNFIYSCRLD